MAKSSRGFASMSAEKAFEIRSKGGRTAQQKGTAHRWKRHVTSAMGKKGARFAGMIRSGVCPRCSLPEKKVKIGENPNCRMCRKIAKRKKEAKQ